MFMCCHQRHTMESKRSPGPGPRSRSGIAQNDLRRNGHNADAKLELKRRWPAHRSQDPSRPGQTVICRRISESRSRRCIADGLPMEVYREQASVRLDEGALIRSWLVGAPRSTRGRGRMLATVRFVAMYQRIIQYDR
jgi:hypothetical protein